MFWILFVMGTFVAIAAALIVGGLATPRHHAVARAVLLAAPPDRVWALVRDVTAYPAWRTELESVETEAGSAGLEWTESTGRSTVRYGATRDEPPAHFGARVLDDDLPPGEWQWTLLPASSGTRVVLTSRGETGNPIARFIGAHMVGYTRDVDRVLRALATAVGQTDARIESVTPGPATGLAQRPA